MYSLDVCELLNSSIWWEIKGQATERVYFTMNSPSYKDKQQPQTRKVCGCRQGWQEVL